MFSYYFLNAMVTVSGVIFLVSTKTMLVSTRIKELQHFAKYTDIFVLSIFILCTNLIVKLGCDYIATRKEKSEGDIKMKNSKWMMFGTMSVAVVALGACGGAEAGSSEQVIIYSNADDEAVEVMESTLDDKGYKGKYVIQSFGTSELGGKMMAEGTDIEADVVTMASYFIESAQASKSMFVDIASDAKPLDDGVTYALPILGNVGAIFVNTDVLEQKGLAVPKTIKDLTDPAYKDLVSFPNIMDSSTAWLLVQAIISEYGEEEGQRF